MFKVKKYNRRHTLAGRVWIAILLLVIIAMLGSTIWLQASHH